MHERAYRYRKQQRCPLRIRAARDVFCIQDKRGRKNLNLLFCPSNVPCAFHRVQCGERRRKEASRDTHQYLSSPHNSPTHTHTLSSPLLRSQKIKKARLEKF
ncbi:hypothetical protein ElyMa_004743600 [Elysia marginata]|uniref:Uncharacterized protein n=1 Tax=Elysia marginata TaxID=1093978 RepID=A0AAV4ICX7_9GAST|nr:hypothetical protein ElyMa_004743600 [Elysia marginata]